MIVLRKDAPAEGEAPALDAKKNKEDHLLIVQRQLSVRYSQSLSAPYAAVI